MSAVTQRSALGLVGSAAVAFAAAGVGSIATAGRIDGWYATLSKPAWTPPGWVFGPVWAVLYAAMALAAWLVWRAAGWRGARRAIVAYLAQLGLNAAWSPAFFGLKNPPLGFVVIVLLLAAIVWTVAEFVRVRRLAALLLVPYLLWVCFAAALNFALWRANP